MPSAEQFTGLVCKEWSMLTIHLATVGH